VAGGGSGCLLSSADGRRGDSGGGDDGSRGGSEQGADARVGAAASRAWARGPEGTSSARRLAETLPAREELRRASEPTTAMWAAGTRQWLPPERGGTK
jgi:hypothetical protein